MGYLIKEKKVFVSELSAAELKDCRARALWLAETHFSSRLIESFDLGNFYGRYMTAEVYNSYVPGQRRICYYLNKVFVYTQRVDAVQGVRRQAEDYYSVQLKREREKEEQRRAMKQGERVTS